MVIRPKADETFEIVYDIQKTESWDMYAQALDKFLARKSDSLSLSYVATEKALPQWIILWSGTFFFLNLIKDHSFTVDEEEIALGQDFSWVISPYKQNKSQPLLFPAAYNNSIQVQKNDECTPEKYFLQEDSGDVKNNPKRSCQFNRTVLEDCSGINDRYYGYQAGKPCIIIKMNRVWMRKRGQERDGVARRHGLTEKMKLVGNEEKMIPVKINGKKSVSKWYVFMIIAFWYIVQILFLLPSCFNGAEMERLF